jgi:hypothetical protein
MQVTMNTETVYKYLTVSVCHDCPNNIGQQFDEADPPFEKEPCKSCEIVLNPSNSVDKKQEQLFKNKEKVNKK